MRIIEKTIESELKRTTYTFSVSNSYSNDEITVMLSKVTVEERKSTRHRKYFITYLWDKYCTRGKLPEIQPSTEIIRLVLDEVRWTVRYVEPRIT